MMTHMFEYGYSYIKIKSNSVKYDCWETNYQHYRNDNCMKCVSVLCKCGNKESGCVLTKSLFNSHKFSCISVPTLKAFYRYSTIKRIFHHEIASKLFADIMWFTCNIYPLPPGKISLWGEMSAS